MQNPATGSTIASVSRVGAEETRAAIAAADSMFPIWSDMPAGDRAKLLRRYTRPLPLLCELNAAKKTERELMKQATLVVFGL